MAGAAFSATVGYNWHTRHARGLRIHSTITRDKHVQHAEGTAGKADDGDGNEDNEGDELDGTSVELFRQSLIQGWGSAGIGSSAEEASWAKLMTDGELEPGMVLLGNPAAFIGDDAPGDGPRRVGLRNIMSPEWPSREKLRWMPVVLITRIQANNVAEGVALTYRSATLMGDLFNSFHSRPLNLGGPDEAGPDEADLTMLHPYPPSQVAGAELLSEESGIYINFNNPVEFLKHAQEWVEEGQGSSLRFRFYYRKIRWSPGDLKDEVEKRIWVPVTCSGDLLLADMDSVGEKPLWAKIVSLIGGDVEDAARLYGLID